MQEKDNEGLILPLKNETNLTVKRPIESESLSKPNSSGSQGHNSDENDNVYALLNLQSMNGEVGLSPPRLFKNRLNTIKIKT